MRYEHSERRRERAPGSMPSRVKWSLGGTFPRTRRFDVSLSLGLVAIGCPIGEDGLTAHFAPSRPKLLNWKPSDSKHASDNFDRKR